MKKILALTLSLCMIFTLFACNGKPKDETTPAETPKSDESTDSASGFELALITDLGTIDDKSFNQGSWEGLVQYAEENNITHKYYQPQEGSDDAYLTAIDLAVEGGAKLIVTPGFLFEVPVYTAQERYPDVKFVLLDGAPHSVNSEYETAPNTVGVTYAEDEAGFLAGYAAVKDGNTKLGFVGGVAVPPVVRYGYGFVEGAEAAAAELNLAAGSITINYNYAGSFSASPEAQAQAAGWYKDGVEVIFAAGGAVGSSIMTAAEAADAKVIGVDVDQSGESPTVITSALKGVRESVYDCISDYYAGKFPGGQDIVFAAENNGVGLVVGDNAKFTSFGQEDLDTVFAKLVKHEIDLVKDLDENGSPLVLPLTYVKVTEVK